MYTLSIVTSSSNTDIKDVNLDIGAVPSKTEPAEEQIKCFICSSPAVPVGLKGKGETSIFDSFCKLLNFPRSVFGKRRLFRAIGNWEFCDSCLLVIREVMTTLDQIQALQNHVEAVKLELQKQIISSHDFSQRSSSETSERSSIEKVRGLFAQCWSSCRVSIPRLPTTAKSQPGDRNEVSQALSEKRDDDDWMDQSHEVDHDDEIEDDRPPDSIKNRKVFKKKKKAKDVSLKKPEYSDDELPFQCYYCPARFRTEKGRGGHTRIHDDEKPLWCKLCGNGVMTTALLIQHLHRMHKNHDHSVCAFCNMDFQTQMDGEEYVCRLDGCEERFSALWELRLHHLSKCAVNPRASSKDSSGGEAKGSTEGHQCGVCSCIFLSLEDMNTHMSSQHGANAQDPDQTSGVIELEILDENSVAFTNLEQQLIEAANEATKPGDAIENAAENSSFQQSSSAEDIHSEYPFPCSYCPKRFKSERARATHSIAHSTQKPYYCKICSTGFMEVRMLLNHVARIHKITDKTSCPFCQLDYQAARDSTTHRYRCALDSCTKDFRTWGRLRSHHLEKCAENSQLNSGPLTCEKCGKVTSGAHSMAIHRGFCKGTPPKQRPHKLPRTKERVPRCSSKPSADLPFKCPLCPKYFATQDFLSLHQLHHNEKLSSYNCSQCDKVVKTKQALRSHIATKHERKFKCICPQCGQGFQVNAMLQRHIDYVHSTELRFACEQCGLRFKRSHQLLYHRRRHTGELPYVCHICGKGYVTPSMFKSHLAIHKGVNFPCDLCAKSFNNMAYLRYHKKYVHEGKARRKKGEAIEVQEEHEPIEQQFGDE